MKLDTHIISCKGIINLYLYLHMNATLNANKGLTSTLAVHHDALWSDHQWPCT